MPHAYYNTLRRGRFQRGRGLFGNLLKGALPILKNLGKSALTSVAKHGVKFLSDTVNNADAVGFKESAKQAVKSRVTAAKNDIFSTGKRVVNSISQPPPKKRRISKTPRQPRNTRKY